LSRQRRRGGREEPRNIVVAFPIPSQARRREEGANAPLLCFEGREERGIGKQTTDDYYLLTMGEREKKGQHPPIEDASSRLDYPREKRGREELGDAMR